MADVTYTIRRPTQGISWVKVVRSMADALASDESREFALVSDFAPKGGTLQHLRNTLAKFPAYADAFEWAYADSSTGDTVLALVRREEQ